MIKFLKSLNPQFFLPNSLILLNFELKCWVENPQLRKSTLSELNFEIDKRFAEEDVTIHFPQRDVWFKNNKP